MTTGIDGNFSTPWQVIVPTGSTSTNLCTNPSFETNTTGWTATSATLTRTAGAGVFGAYGGRVLVSATNGGAQYAGPATTNGAALVASVYVNAASSAVRLQLNINGGAVVELAHPGDGLWHRLEVTGTSAGSTSLVTVYDSRSSAWTSYDIDGVQFETGVSLATTYIDGDQDGCTWTGTAHGSTSTRDGRDGRGGTISELTSGSLTVKPFSGIGVPDMNIATQQLALGDGEIFQRQTAKPRVVMMSVLAAVSNLAALHAARLTLLGLLNPDKRSNRSPIRLRYAGAATTKTLDAYLEKGMGFDLGGFTQRNEMLPLRFTAPDPYFYGETESQASLTTSQNVTSVGHLAYRDANGTWSSMGGGSSSASTAFIWNVERLPDGRIVAVGNFGTMGGVANANHIAIYDPSAGTWAQLGGANPGAFGSGSVVYGLAVAANGDVYVGGSFTDLGGATAADDIGVWSFSGNTWAGVGASGANGTVYSVAFDATGNLFAAGAFTTIGGTGAAGAAYWTGSAWVSAATGFPAIVGANPSLQLGPDGRMYCSVNSAVYVWTGSTWSSVGSADNTVLRLKTTGGRLYAVGSFTTMGGVSANRIARYNGSIWEPLGSGAPSGSINSVATDAAGSVYVGGAFIASIGSVTLIDSLAVWNGSSWLPFPANPPDTAAHTNDIYSVFRLNDGGLILSWTAAVGTFGTTLAAEVATTVTNSGSANAYPIIGMPTSGTLYYLKNVTTGQAIYFNGLAIQTGEAPVLDLRPGRKTFSSAYRTLLPYILAGSDLSTFCLAPGTNQIALYASAGSASMHWRPRSWSAD